MSCPKREQSIHGYLDGELDLAGSLEFEQHMHECEICARSYRNQTMVRSSLKVESLYYGAPDKLKKRIQSSLRKEARVEGSRRAFGWLAYGDGLAGLNVLCSHSRVEVIPGTFAPSGDELLAQEIVSDHVRSLQMPGHLTDVLSSDQHTVKPWFDGKVDFAPPVRDFANQDFRLYGGRLEYLSNRSVATLIYQRRLHYINLYIWPSDEAASTAEVATQRQGYNLIHWTSSGMSYWAISDLNNVELHDFARLVQQGQ